MINCLLVCRMKFNNGISVSILAMLDLLNSSTLQPKAAFKEAALEHCANNVSKSSAVL